MRSQGEIRRSPMSAANVNQYGTYYLISINKHQVKDYVTKADLDRIIIQLKWLETSLDIKDSAYELGHKYNQLHFHAIVKTKPSFRYRHLTKLDGYQIYWKKIIDNKDIVKISTYIHKDSSNRFEQEEILECNYYLHNYAF